jgi:hypothetical protein
MIMFAIPPLREKMEPSRFYNSNNILSNLKKKVFLTKLQSCNEICIIFTVDDHIKCSNISPSMIHLEYEEHKTPLRCNSTTLFCWTLKIMVPLSPISIYPLNLSNLITHLIVNSWRKFSNLIPFKCTKN